MFGGGKEEWGGFVSDNDLAVGLHPGTHSEFDFKVRSYPSLIESSSSKTNFLMRVAAGINAENKIKVSSSEFEILPVEQSYETNGILRLVRSPFTFLRQEGEANATSAGIYHVTGRMYFIHYLANVRSDAETNYSATVFHAMVFIPQRTSVKERERLIATVKQFIEQMDLSREPQLPHAK